MQGFLKGGSWGMLKKSVLLASIRHYFDIFSKIVSIPTGIPCFVRYVRCHRTLGLIAVELLTVRLWAGEVSQ